MKKQQSVFVFCMMQFVNLIYNPEKLQQTFERNALYLAATMS